ncbi:MAG: ABC transporter ATP-binding protein [Chloroflexi bacterium]|uniref:ABC transporter ATP-binding protein n=1 Tax=Candidatus Chlorohelix allophototropha TaxID=3003348 RepID=A0A8T7M057_9CHLR|nr:ABC transporter ATP-binding protein [Chloroflexota bacterium]WJW67009.1 ABC transporter ATP-binding protein [Chloroflexota bacterium L227-S17]
MTVDNKTLLILDKVSSFYGNIQALRNISLTVNPGEIVTLIGSNGAGKTTTLKTISGLIRPRTGHIYLKGERLDGIDAQEVVKKGISHSPEGRKIFSRMTVLENLEMGAFLRNDKAGIQEDLEKVYGLFPRLKERIKQKAGTMSGGEQQMLAIGRAMMARPSILLLDEPSMGLSPKLVEQIFEIILDINNQGTTILLVEQNALAALSIAARGYVLQTGSIVLEDSGQNLLSNEAVRRTYLGEEVA